MTKEEKIKEAWGNISDKINEDGWLYFGYACNGWDDVEEWLESNKLNSDESYYDMVYNQCDNGDLINIKIRPKSLQGIENNNGWIKIESEADLPLSGDLYLCKLAINAWDNEDYIYCLMKDFHKSVPSKLNRALEYTHYQSIVKPKPPLF